MVMEKRKSRMKKGEETGGAALPESKLAARFQMTLILAGTMLAGFLASKILLELRLHAILVRYPLAVVFSYLAFVGLVKLWLITLARTRAKNKGSSSGSLSNILDVQSSGGGSGSGRVFQGGGGNFGGGGASAGFNAGMGNPVPPVLQSSTQSLGGKSGGKFRGFSGIDIDDGGVILIVIAVVAVIVFGAGAYLVYQAPVILSEALGQVLLAGGLMKSSQKMSHPDWIGSVIHATWIPFAVVLTAVTALGYTIHVKCPQAITLVQAIRECVR